MTIHGLDAARFIQKPHASFGHRHFWERAVSRRAPRGGPGTRRPDRGVRPRVEPECDPLRDQRRVPRHPGYFNLTTHFPWVGLRTNDPGGAHVEYLRGIENPVGVKVGTGCSREQVARWLRE